MCLVLLPYECEGLDLVPFNLRRVLPLTVRTIVHGVDPSYVARLDNNG